MAKCRGGYLYVAVLFTSLMVAVIVAGALAASTSQLRRGNDHADRVLATQLAESELHLQATRMQASTQWRSSLANNQFSAWRNLLDGRVRHRYFDNDGTLTDDDFDDVTLTVHAQVNNAEAALSIDLANAASPHRCLNYSVTTLGDMGINNDTNVVTETPLQVAAGCTTDSSGFLITPQLGCAGEVNITVFGNRSSDVAATLPSDILALYTALGTPIASGLLPQDKGNYLISNVIFSSTSNPYSTELNPEGVYVIDGNSKDVIVQNCRIEGTIVFISYKSLRVTGGMVWNTMNVGRPALIASKSVTFDGLSSTLSESATDTNFNPSHTPSRGGVTNTTKLDVFPTAIRGIVYSLENISITPMVGDERLNFFGTLCAENIYVSGRVNVLAEPSLLSNPPLGFHDPSKMKFVERSMRRVATP